MLSLSFVYEISAASVQCVNVKQNHGFFPHFLFGDKAKERQWINWTKYEDMGITTASCVFPQQQKSNVQLLITLHSTKSTRHSLTIITPLHPTPYRHTEGWIITMVFLFYHEGVSRAKWWRRPTPSPLQREIRWVSTATWWNDCIFSVRGARGRLRETYKHLLSQSVATVVSLWRLHTHTHIYWERVWAAEEEGVYLVNHLWTMQGKKKILSVWGSLPLGFCQL